MKRQMGLWIDHKKAIIVTVDGDKELVTRIESNIEREAKPEGFVRPKTAYGHHDRAADDKLQRRFLGHLNRYYDKVISHLREAQSIVAFGPGAAKLELAKRFESKAHSGKVVCLQTVDKMTERQIAAKVRRYFQQ